MRIAAKCLVLLAVACSRPKAYQYRPTDGGMDRAPEVTLAAAEAGAPACSPGNEAVLALRPSLVSGRLRLEGRSLCDATRTADTHELVFEDAIDATVNLRFRIACDGAFRAWVAPGKHLVRYESTSGPTQIAFVVEPALAVGEAAVDLGIVTVPLRRVSGVVRVGGDRAFFDSVVRAGSCTQLALASSDGRARVTSPSACSDGALAFFAPSGAYSATISGLAVSPDLLGQPAFAAGPLHVGTVEIGDDPATQVFDLRAVRLAGTVNTAAPLDWGETAPCKKADAVLMLVRKDEWPEREFRLPLCAGRFDGHVLPGSYRAALLLLGSRREFALLPAQEMLVADRDRNDVKVEIPSVLLRGELRARGVQLTSAAPSGPATIFLDAPADPRFIIAPTTAAGPVAYETLAPPGRYRLSLAGTDNGVALPWTTHIVDGDLALVGAGATVTRDIDLDLRTVSGTLTVNGAAPDAARCAERTRILLRDTARPGQATGIDTACRDGKLTFSGPVHPGSYDVEIVRGPIFDGAGSLARAAVDLRADVAALALDVSEVPFAARLGWQRCEPVPEWALCEGKPVGPARVVFEELDRGYRFHLAAATLGEVVRLPLYPGRYRTRVYLPTCPSVAGAVSTTRLVAAGDIVVATP